ncbi:pirin family protein [Pseudomonas sp. NPDC087358]|uniref:pirin family protein n=1 Tax=Pseudomonas sp. NPDC087358 TaxID=3364439 RepID=UPI003850E961
MIELRPHSKLGGSNHGWLDTRHHFSFADYQDPNRTNWGRMRVWNDDTIAPNSGFATHAHEEMEIITYVRKGAITHQDDLGNKGRTVAGDVQVMSAGTGIQHSEYNLEDEETKIFQIWIFPDQKGLPPSWGVRPFPTQISNGRFVTLASGFDDDHDALRIRACARLAAATIDAAEQAEYSVETGRKIYVVVASGSIEVNGVLVNSGDGAAIQHESVLKFLAHQRSEVVLVDISG